jgi:hypothetical protein
MFVFAALPPIGSIHSNGGNPTCHWAIGACPLAKNKTTVHFPTGECPLGAPQFLGMWGCILPSQSLGKRGCMPMYTQVFRHTGMHPHTFKSSGIQKAPTGPRKHTQTHSEHIACGFVSLRVFQSTECGYRMFYRTRATNIRQAQAFVPKAHEGNCMCFCCWLPGSPSA